MTKLLYVHIHFSYVHFFFTRDLWLLTTQHSVFRGSDDVLKNGNVSRCNKMTNLFRNFWSILMFCSFTLQGCIHWDSMLNFGGLTFGHCYVLAPDSHQLTTQTHSCCPLMGRMLRLQLNPSKHSNPTPNTRNTPNTHNQQAPNSSFFKKIKYFIICIACINNVN